MKKFSKILSVFLCVAILVGLISPTAQINAGALEYQASDISTIEIVQNNVKISAHDGIIYADDVVLLKDSFKYNFSYKITFYDNTSETVSYNYLYSIIGISIDGIEYIDNIVEYDGSQFFEAGNKQVVIHCNDWQSSFNSYVYITPYLYYIDFSGTVVDYDKMKIFFEDDETYYTYYWRIKPKQNNVYDFYSRDWKKISGHFMLFDKYNNIIPYDEDQGWTLKAGQEYALRITYRYKSGYYGDVIFDLEPSKDHTHIKGKIPTVTKATTTKNGSIVYKCAECGGVASSTTVYYPKTVTLAATSYVYNGKTKTPAVTVKDSKGKILKKGIDYTVSYASGRKNVGKYKVTVTFKGNYSGSKNLYFTITPPKTTVSKLTAGKKSIRVNITKKSTQVSGYQIQYATAKSFKSAKIKTLSSYKTTSVTLTKLTAKKTYYVRVRTYKTVGGVKYYSAWSSYKYTKTK